MSAPVPPKSQPPALTDRTALERHRARAVRAIAAPGSPLPDLIAILADEIHSRLAEINRTFTAPALVSGFPEHWQGHFPEAKAIADAPLLDLAPEAHDLVIHAGALHWADDPLGQIIQCRRALKPDGLFLAVFFGGRSLSELRAALAEAETELTGGLSPRVLPMTDLRDAGGLLQRAGLALPVADGALRDIAYRDPNKLVADLRGLGETNALAQRHRRPMAAGLWPLAMARYAEGFGRDGLWPVTLELLWLTGWAPGPGQQQPLRPGSAVSRLEAALREAESPARDTPSV